MHSQMHLQQEEIQSMPLFYVQHYIDSALKYQDPKFIAIELRAAAKDPDVYTTGHVLAARYAP